MDHASADALDGLGRALWWLKDVRGAIDARTRAYAGLRRAGRHAEAVKVAVWLAREHRSLYRNDAVADGWVARARSIVDRVVDGAAHGWVSLAECEAAQPVDAAIALAHRAVTVARHHDDPDLEVVSLARLGALEVSAGSVESGHAHVHEAMAAASAGEGRDPQSVGEACCVLTEVASLLGDTARVGSWSGVLDGFRTTYDFPPLTALGSWSARPALSAFCGACCGGIYLVTGRLDEAEQELTAAIHELADAELHSRCVHPVTQLAELRVLQGRLEEAAALLSAYEDLPECTRPLSALDLARGDSARASDRLRARIERLRDRPVATFPLWTLLVDAELADGDLQAAETAVRAAARLARVTSSPPARRRGDVREGEDRGGP